MAFDELRMLAASGVLRPHHLVWQPEFGDTWRRAAEVEGLCVTPSDTPPPAPQWRQPSVEVALSGVTGARPSCLQAAARAYSRMIELLFQPFDLNRWFGIGFCAWLAYLGVGGGGSNKPQDAQYTMPKQLFDQSLEKFSATLVSPPATAQLLLTLLIVLLFAALLCKLRSRGDFMFLHRWYQPETSVGECWRAARASGHDLFLWRVAFFIIATLVLFAFLVASWLTVLQPYMNNRMEWSAELSTPTAILIALGTLWVIVVGVIAHLTKAVVVPVMYWHGVTAGRAWCAALSLCNQYPFAMLGYLLCGVLCAVVGIMVLCLIGLTTCCVGFIVLALPYIGAVALLPYTLFFRGYAVYFISQWRNELVPASHGEARYE